MTSLVKRCSRIALILALLFPAQVGWGFERDTHVDITVAAHDRSAISDALRDLGIDPARRLNGGLLRGSRPPGDWLVKGARDEDDTLSTNFARYRNHFYDPVNNRGLTAGLLRGEPAPDWALEDREEFLTQAFSYRDARQGFLTALIAPAPGDRESALASTFEILGHVIHPLQDMASPPHTRNDLHGGFGFGPTSLFERYLDQEQVRRRLNFGGTPVRFGLRREYWTTGDGRGLAEFVNRNFVSEGTNFTARVEGAIGGGYPNPVLRLGADDQGRAFETTLDIQTQLEPGLRDRNANLIEGSVTFFANNFIDPISGEALRNERMTTLSLFDRGLEQRGASLVFTLNRYNVEAQAAFLVPRAVGYSAGLLDYFFRGKLDVELVEDSNDSSLFQLTGINGSSDELVAGTLKLYADDPMGKRSEVAAVTSVPVQGVQQGQDLFAVPPTFVPPEDAERFVAVYQGTLGLEKKGGTFLGGVIGKVLGGVRVEEVFSDGTRWRLRTPKGVFLLPLVVAEFEEVRWGDGDNLLVARTPLGPDQPNRVVAYEVQRVPNSVELKTVDTPDGPEAQLIKKTEAVFPFGMPLGTTVKFSQTIRYTQHLLTFDGTLVFQWVPVDPTDPESGSYAGPVDTEFTPLAIEPVVDATVPFAQNFPLVLDLTHHFSSGFARPYLWALQEVAVDVSGRLLGLVGVFLTEPDISVVSLPFFGANFLTGPEVTGQVTLTPAFPRGVDPLLWAVVDITTGQVVASTAEPLITIATQEARETSLAVGHHFDRFEGGPRGRVEDRGWFTVVFQNPEGLPPITDLTEFRTQGGVLGLAVDGWLRKELKEDLARVGLFDFQVSSSSISRDFATGCSETSCTGIRSISSASEVTRSPMQLQDVRRTRPAPAGERLVFVAAGGIGRTTPVSTILVWDPGPPRAQVLLQFSEDFPQLGPATRAAVLASTFVLVGEQVLPRASFLIPLEGTQEPIVFPGVDLLASFTLLDPTYLYSVQDLKFFRSKPPLQRTAFPAKLADLPDKSNPVGDYHAIRVP